MQEKLRKFLKKAQKPLVVVLGPTASGKTALSLKIAHLAKGEIISTDSRQIYTEMDISTDALPMKDRENIPHHLINITPPDKPLTLAEYNQLALEEINKIYERKRIPILVGGTGLYISAIIEGYNVPKIPPDPKLRAKLEKEAEKKGHEAVHKKLQKLDPKAAAKIHPNNLRYVIRAIEINLATKKNKPQNKKDPAFDLFMIGVNWPRNELYKRIEQRVELQVKRGLLDEVKALLAKKYDKNLPALSSLGIKEIIPYFKDKTPLEGCLHELKLNTRHYAKRQMTWFKRYANVHWLTPKEFEKFVKTGRLRPRTAKAGQA